METPLLATKLFIPDLHPTWVSRTRLIRMLNRGLQHNHRLLLSAQAGAGKTTLLADWVRHAIPRLPGTIRTAWLSLDEEDNDPSRFWHYLFAAVQNALPDEHPLPYAGEPIPTENFSGPLTNLINILTHLEGKLVLVLDDYHAIRAEQIHQGITFLLTHQPEQLCMVIATRMDPPLQIANLRARSQLTELRVSDLSFQNDETQAFLNEKMGLGLAAQDILTLNHQTEGWAVGLQLAALSMQGRQDPRAFLTSFAGTHHYILAYLSEQVIEGQPKPIQHFLLQTSILSRLSGALCDAVTGTQHSETLLAELQKRNLFITPLDDHQQWYRYHHLFADLLQTRLRQVESTATIQALHERASIWFEQGGFLREAVHHAQLAQDHERVAELAIQAIQASVLDNRLTGWLEWIARLPDPILEANLQLRIYQGLALFLDGQIQEAQDMLHQSRSMVEQQPDPQRQELITLLDTITALLGGLQHGLAGNVAASVEMSSKARDLAAEANNIFFSALAHEGLALGLTMQGKLEKAAAASQTIITLAESAPLQPPHNRALPFAGMGYVQLADVFREWNHLEPAGHAVHQAIALYQHAGSGKPLAEAYLVLSRIRQARGDLAGAGQAAVQANKAAAALSPYTLTHFRIAAQQMRLHLAAGETEQVLAWGSPLPQTIPMRSDKNPLPGSMHETRQLILARAHLAQNTPDKAIAILNACLPAAQSHGRVKHLIEILLLKAIGAEQMGRTPQAAALLEQALTYAEPGGFVRIFLDEGPPAVQLLKDFCARPGPPDQIQRYGFDLLEQAGTSITSLSAGQVGSHFPPTAPLTQREAEILRWIDAGLSNQEIADQLVLALNTVKRHTSNIYSKLDVSSRTQAISRGHELGILESN